MVQSARQEQNKKIACSNPSLTEDMQKGKVKERADKPQKW
jgi:hypothetical protein